MVLGTSGSQEKGCSGSKSLVAGFYVWPPLQFIYTCDILGLPPRSSIIHDHFSRVIPPDTFARDWPLAKPPAHAPLGMGTAGPYAREGQKPRLTAGCPHTSQFIPSLAPIRSHGPESLGWKLGVSCIDSRSIRSVGKALLAQSQPRQGSRGCH